MAVEPLSPETDTRTRYVLVGGRLYLEALMVEAMNEATVEYLERHVPQGSSPRRIARTVRDMKTPQAHRKVMNVALRKLALSELYSDPAAVSDETGVVVARFPTMLDKQIDNT